MTAGLSGHRHRLRLLLLRHVPFGLVAALSLAVSAGFVPVAVGGGVGIAGGVLVAGGDGALETGGETLVCGGGDTLSLQATSAAAVAIAISR